MYMFSTEGDLMQISLIKESLIALMNQHTDTKVKQAFITILRYINNENKQKSTCDEDFFHESLESIKKEEKIKRQESVKLIASEPVQTKNTLIKR